MIRPFGKEEDIEKLFPLIKSWLNECRTNDYGIETDAVEYLSEVYRFIQAKDSDLLVMELDGRIIGLMGITATKSPLGRQMVANGLYWYTLPEHRGKGISFIAEAKKWGKRKGCSHIMFNASNMAGPLHDKVCSIYERLGMKRFETTYIGKLE